MFDATDALWQIATRLRIEIAGLSSVYHKPEPGEEEEEEVELERLQGQLSIIEGAIQEMEGLA